MKVSLKLIKCINLLVFIIIVLVLLYCAIVTLFSTYDAGSYLHTAELIKIAFAVIGAIWVLTEFYIKKRKEENDHVRLKVEVEEINEFLTLKTSVENNTLFPKDIYFSFMIISKFGTDFQSAMNNYFHTHFSRSNNYYNLKPLIGTQCVLLDNNTLIVLLPFYYKENVRVGNEYITYSLPLASTELEKEINQGEINHYEVRFFVYRNRKDSNNYHRVTQCCFSTSQKISYMFNLICNNTNLKLKK